MKAYLLYNLILGGVVLVIKLVQLARSEYPIKSQTTRSEAVFALVWIAAAFVWALWLYKTGGAS